jgi:CheY-like chemotaxis protein
MTDKILVIDDQITENSKLGKRINSIVSDAGFETIFAQTWMDEGFGSKAIDIIKNDNDIKFIMLDVLFPEQSYSGYAIFEEIKKMMPDLPVAILTRMNIYTEAESFMEMGAVFYIVKKSFERRLPALIQYLKTIASGKDNKDLKMKYQKDNKFFYFDILNKDGSSALKRKRKMRIYDVITTILMECIHNPDRQAQFPEKGADGVVKGLEPFTRGDIQKEVWKFNKSLRNSSGCRIPYLLKGGGIHDASAFKLVIGSLEEEKNG